MDSEEEEALLIFPAIADAIGLEARRLGGELEATLDWSSILSAITENMLLAVLCSGAAAG